MEPRDAACLREGMGEVRGVHKRCHMSYGRSMRLCSISRMYGVCKKCHVSQGKLAEDSMNQEV